MNTLDKLYWIFSRSIVLPFTNIFFVITLILITNLFVASLVRTPSENKKKIVTKALILTPIFISFSIQLWGWYFGATDSVQRYLNPVDWPLYIIPIFLLTQFIYSLVLIKRSVSNKYFSISLQILLFYYSISASVMAAMSIEGDFL